MDWRLADGWGRVPGYSSSHWVVPCGDHTGDHPHRQLFCTVYHYHTILYTENDFIVKLLVELLSPLILHKYLWTQLFEAIVKSPKSRFQVKPCLKHEIHLLFEHGFYIKILKMGHRLFTWRQTTMQGCPGISTLSWFLLTLTSFHFSRNDVKKSEKQNGVNGCVQCNQSDFSMIFQASLTGVFMESYRMQE